MGRPLGAFAFPAPLLTPPLRGGAFACPSLPSPFVASQPTRSTHGAVCPVDVVKTRIQLDPVKYNSGMIGGFKTVIAEEGVGALATGLAPTAVGYFIQGWFKFGGVEFFKINAAQSLGDQGAWDNRTSIYLGSAAAAETIADIFLCP